MYWVVVLLTVLHSCHRALGKEDIVNQKEFEALCRMINWAEERLEHIKVTKRVTQEALKIGVRYLEVAGEEECRHIAKAQEDSCTKKMEDRKRNCGLYKNFWEEAQKAVKERAFSGEKLERKIDALGEHTVDEIKKKGMYGADIYHDVEAKRPSGNMRKMEEHLIKALYGMEYFSEDIKGGDSDRSRVCGQNLRNNKATGGWSLAVDLLCLCATHNSWKGRKKVCCADCSTGENRDEWNPESNEAPRWDFLKQKCAGRHRNRHDMIEKLSEAEENLMKTVTKIGTIPYTHTYVLGTAVNSRIKPCGADINKQQEICVHYGSDNGTKLPWLKALQKVEKEMKLTLKDKQDKSAKLKRMEELNQEIESLIRGDTGRGGQRGRQKRSVNPENSVPETPADPSDPTQSVPHTNEKKRSVRKPISTGNGATKSYNSEEDDSYEYECEGENSACSDSPAKPTVKNSKSAINCPLGLILLLV
ncbi:variant surface glycoprotein (VSG, atypical), putative [Trypanosoma brucei brucei TREU927]|uniref:Variant surface glycoprotein (VSG, atypical), putative n=1 Tax=Trypanosoma brucei brucei (strain 927/4 GUTat10.1) TaxID=185431 RepID=Q38CT8_TRYB2|nr:variant surface glycoprotein [Trypanosoma brucei brucei TREU927]EAN77382.1 variant surface glycoprotein (VSG, atypical), putative [Trypanosoma brucei brucei TREU927]